MSVWSSLRTLHTTYVLCIAISFLNSSLIFMQLCVVCITICCLCNNLLYIQPSFLHSPLFFMWSCVHCIVIHSSQLELWSSHITCTHHLFVLLAHVPFRYVHLSFFCWHVLYLLSSWVCVFFFIAWSSLIFDFSVASCFDCSLSFYQVFAIVWNSPWILKNCWLHWEWLSSSFKHCNMFGKKTIHLQQFFFQHLAMKGKSWYSFYDCCFA